MSIRRSGRVMPKPFQRKSISITMPAGRQRQWKNVKACDLEVGAIVANVGEIAEVKRHDLGITVYNVFGTFEQFYVDETVLAFL